MSTPYNDGDFQPYPEHPEGSHPENGAGYSAYNSPNSPSSYDAFEVNTAASMAGASALRFHGQQLTDNAPGDGTSPHPINDPASNGWFHVKGNGKLEIIEALTWGVKAVFANAKLWIPLGVVYTVLTLLGQFLPGVGSMISMIGMLAFVPWMVGVVLQQTLVKQLTYNDAKAPAYGKTLGVAALLGVVAGIVSTILLMVLAFGALTSIDPATLPDNPDNVAPDEMWNLVRPILGALAVTGVIGLLVMPFFTFQAWYAADNNGSFGNAISGGFRAGASNYLKILGFVVLAGLINLVGAALFFVGLVVTVPGTMLAAAHAYRQISGGPVPKEATA
ncbi:hypothetical protein CAFEA_10880 [Corynebacterium afermentans subsp. afermentans]|uniref:Transmembrane protein n=1 Tax=Corynebacterium afermentans TaxID=38286 RepID=A0A9X8WIW1_9CORY|nr:hypothetical protein [Corynebacterium afermentans]OAA17412.1 hypothetical protein Caferm_02555 [Corynebacterium afermentans subsp. afermentans]WJY57738.1 hypothetical protein CAFEA_10880 [Corynebacterium afermentans subsp. afermentans]SIQ49247.1 hypothetical protein SAMN05421802_11613 [Corynebacterium afermentans]